MDEPAVVVGRVVKAHGIRGELAIDNRSDNPDRWSAGAVVFTREGRELTVRSVREHGGRLLVTFEGMTRREQADELRGQVLLVPESWLPDLPEGEWWSKDLEGCRVWTESGRDLGTVREVVPNPANDLWVTVDASGAETLIPALKDILLKVDVAAKEILVRDVPGLTAPDDEV